MRSRCRFFSCCSSMSRVVAIGTDDGHVRVVDAVTGTAQVDVKGHAEAVLCVVLSPDGATPPPFNPDLWPGRIATGRCVFLGMTSPHPPLLPPGRTLASAGADQCWKLWDGVSGDELLCIRGHDGSGECICEQDAFGICSQIDGRCPVVGHAGPVEALHFSPCGRRVAAGGKDGAVFVWNAGTGAAELRLEAHREPVLNPKPFPQRAFP